MKNSNLVLTIVVGEYHQSISKLTLPSIKKYAEKIHADFKCIESSSFEEIEWEKTIIFKLLNDYKRIIFFDIDLIIRQDCPSLFDIIPDNKLGLFNSGKYFTKVETIQVIGVSA